MSDPLAAQLPFTLQSTHLDALGTRYEGKVRDVYRCKDRLILIASDRLSAFDRVLTTIPFKGEVLNRLAQFWFDKTAHIIPNHILDVPDANVTVARACEPFRIEMVVRGYLTGSLWRDFQRGAHGAYGLSIAPGMKKDEPFEQPLLTPSTKARVGEHDAPLSPADVVSQGLASARDWQRLSEVALALFGEGQRWARSRGLILVDTKYEFGRVGDVLYAIDEMHTPDSSRYWQADGYATRLAAGEEQRMLDKENVRQWLIRERNFSGHGEAPVLPDDLRVNTARTYLAAYEQITGAPLVLTVGDVQQRLVTTLRARGYLPESP